MRLLAAVFVATLALAPARAQACAPCGAGDPTLTTAGAGIPYQGRVRVSLLARHLTQQVGDEAVAERRLTLGLAVSPLDWLTITGALPLVAREVEHPNLVRETGIGLGDAELRGRFLVFRERSGSAEHLLYLEAGARLPTTTPLSDERGRALSLDAQPGTQSFDPLAGVRWHVLGDRVASFASAFLVVPTEGMQGYRAGVGGLVSWTGQASLLPELALQLGADLRIEDVARIADQALAAGGGFVSFVSFGVVVAPVPELLFSGSVRIPVAQSLGGGSSDEPIVELGVIGDVGT